MATATAQTEKPLIQVLRERDTALLDIKLTLEEFEKRITITYDDRFRWRNWRVQGDVHLYYWIYDHIIHDKKSQPLISDAEVIKAAYDRYCQIQERRGQINFQSVYVKECEEVELIPRSKSYEYAVVRVVQDRIDGLYRFSSNYHAVSGGCSYSPSLRSVMVKTRTEAVLCGAREILDSLESGWQAKDEPKKYNPFINKIKTFIEKLEAQERQPSLFG